MDDRVNFSSLIVSDEFESLGSTDLIGPEAFAVSKATHSLEVCLKRYLITVCKVSDDVTSKARWLMVGVGGVGEENESTNKRDYIVEDSVKIGHRTCMRVSCFICLYSRDTFLHIKVEIIDMALRRKHYA